MDNISQGLLHAMIAGYAYLIKNSINQLSVLSIYLKL
jgi:hypothetical protein